MAARTLISKLPSLLAARSARSTLHRLRPIVAVADSWRRPIAGVAELRAFSTRPTTSSLNDPTPNWSNRPPKETILLDGCDFEHWLVVVDPPEPNMTRDEIIDSYIKKLAEVIGSEEEARMKIYSVSTKHYFAFGALVSEEVSYKIKALSKVRWVLPDSYLDVRNKDYGGEPFIDGQAVPYDPKYHEEWILNNERANERNRRNDRPRNNDRSRNFDRRKVNMQQNYQSRPPPPNQDFQNPVPPRDGPPMPNNAPIMPGSTNTMPPRNMPPMQGGAPQNGPPMPNNAPLMPGSTNTMPPRNMPPMQGGTPQNGPPMPNREFNSGGPPMPNREYGNGGPLPRAYPNQMPSTQNSYPPAGPAYQGNPGYQGGNPGGPVNQRYGQGYQGGPQGYNNGGSPNYQQGGGPNYHQGGYNQAIPGYTPGAQGAVSGPNYQQAPPNYQQGDQVGGPYQGNVPGRD